MTFKRDSCFSPILADRFVPGVWNFEYLLLFVAPPYSGHNAEGEHDPDGGATRHKVGLTCPVQDAENGQDNGYHIGKDAQHFEQATSLNHSGVSQDGTVDRYCASHIDDAEPCKRGDIVEIE